MRVDLTDAMGFPHWQSGAGRGEGNQKENINPTLC